MDEIKFLLRKLDLKSKLLVVLLVLVALGLITFLVSPFILIWGTWALAWRVGLTGLCSSGVLFAGWWITYNSLYATIEAIKNNKIWKDSENSKE